MSDDMGVTYVAWGKCIPEAIRSSKSARANGLKTCIITKDDVSNDDFDVVVRPREGELSQHFNIVQNFSLSPWKKTLWLDSDTVILGDLSYAFEMASAHGISICIAPHVFLMGRGLNQIPDEAIEYNCGAFWVDREHPAMQGFGEKWMKIVKDHDGSGWWTDQSSLSVALYELRVNPYVLPMNFNFRGYLNREIRFACHSRDGFGPVKIWHSRSPVPSKLARNGGSFWRLYPNPLWDLYRFLRPLKAH